MSAERPADPAPAPAMYALATNDPDHRLVARAGLHPDELADIERVLAAAGRLRDVEREASRAQQEYMRLGETDMRALHYLVVCRHTGHLATPGDIARHLDVSTAAVTKLLDRLERGGHVVREPHPSDRRALSVRITDATYETAVSTVGVQQARRFGVVAALSPEERAVVTRFLERTAAALAVSPGDLTPPSP